MPHQVQHQPQASRFVIEAAGERAVLEYRLREGCMVITHTGVPEALRNQGLAAELTRAALDHVRTHGWKVIPDCAYAAGFLQRHPEYAALQP